MLGAILTASTLLLIGFVLRARVPALQWLYVPASVAGGLAGLLLFQTLTRVPATADTVSSLSLALRGWPGPLIAVVFAGLLLEHPSRRLADAAQGAASAGIMVWIIVLGQAALGLAATWLVIAPAYDVPPAFGQLIEAGFAGGHATAASLGEIYGELLDFPPGMDLGLFMATIGLVFSVVSGIALVNIGVRRGWTRRGTADLRLISGLENRSVRVPIAFARVRGEVIDPLAFQVLILAAAVGVGVVMQRGFASAVGTLPEEHALRALENVPLFLFTLIGGLLVRKTMVGLGVGDLIDAESIKRLVAIAMEFLIVAAVASLRLEAVVTYFLPLLLLVTLGCAWAVVCLVVIAPRLLPADYWFELGIINYGMSTGTTAQGMMLLRIVDPDLESPAAEDYALAAPLSAPFVGGGLITLALPVLLPRIGLPLATIGLLVALAGLLTLGRLLRRRA
ncbi:MAG: sodium:glutamate symporter [Phycisphaerales bacterium]|nr:sodium:glutamate symporter [Phycisphaerales bacterium]